MEPCVYPSQVKWVTSTRAQPRETLSTDPVHETTARATVRPGVRVGVHLEGAGILLAGSLGCCLSSLDGGRTWTESASLPADFHADAIARSSAGSRILLGGVQRRQAALFASSDLGSTWRRIPLPVSGFRESGVRGLCLLDDGQGWLCGWRVRGPDGREPLLLTTSDRGTSWAITKSLPEDLEGELEAVHFFSSHRGLLATSDAILGTTDGSLWQEVVGSPLLQDFGSWSFSARGHIWVGGGQLIHSADFGHKWSKAPTLPPGPDNVAFFSDAARGWLAVEPGTIWGTADAGRTWEREWAGDFMTLGFLIAERTLLAFGTEGVVLSRSL